MVFSKKDKILIENLYVYEGYSTRQLTDDFPIRFEALLAQEATRN